MALKSLRSVRSVLSGIIFVAAVGVIASVIPSTVLSQSTGTALEQVVSDATDSSSVNEFWTEERMARAEPLPVLMMDGTGNVAGAQPLAPPMASAPPYMAYVDSDGRPRVRLGTAPVLSFPVPIAGTSPYSFTRYRLFPDLTSTYRAYPYRTIGKLFFTIGTAMSFCSASSVVSLNFSVIWTAGHCVYTPGSGFHTNFLFVPARRLGVNPFGGWTAAQVFTLVGWAAGLSEYDHGAIVANRGGTTNERLGDRVGSLNFLANVARMQHWHLFGYPAPDTRFRPVNPRFDGEHQEICAASWATDDQPTGGSQDPPTIGIGCDQTGGASGGPWIVDFSGLPSSGTQSFNFVNGNNSYKYGAPNDLRVYSPYFTNGAINLLNTAANIEVP